MYSEAIQPRTSDCLALICCSGDYPEKDFEQLHVPYDECVHNTFLFGRVLWAAIRFIKLRCMHTIV